MTLNEYKLSPEMEIEADRMNDEFMADMDAAWDEHCAEMDAEREMIDDHIPTATEIAYDIVNCLASDIDDRLYYMEMAMKRAGASEAILDIARRYGKGIVMDLNGDAKYICENGVGPYC